MPGRQNDHVSDRRRWAPTALDALVAVTPATSLAAAFGLAGGGYLTGREDLAACGAVAGAFGLVVERFQTRSVRVRLRRERSRYRSDMRDVNRILHDVQRDLAGLRADLDEVRDERDAVRAELKATLDQLAAARTSAVAAVAPAAPAEQVAPAEHVVPVAQAVVAEAVVAEAVVIETVVAEPVVGTGDVVETGDAAAAVEAGADAPVLDLRELDRPLPLALMLPGQLRSPIATGGIPLLPPGPREPVRAIDLRSVPYEDDDTQPLPVMTAELADALVYAAMAEADAAQVTRVLERPQPRHSGVLHAGDAHHAGDYTRGSETAGTPTLYVVRHGKHVA